MCHLLVDAVNPVNPDALKFSEFFHLVCAVCMLGEAEMTRMVFKAMDTHGRYYLEYVI